jgi:hypothetical protein
VPIPTAPGYSTVGESITCGSNATQNCSSCRIGLLWKPEKGEPVRVCQRCGWIKEPLLFTGPQIVVNDTPIRAGLNFRQARVADRRAGSKGCAFRLPAAHGA